VACAPTETSGAPAPRPSDDVARAPLQFATQREDPRLEERLLDKLGPGGKRFFGVTAAGCTLLQLSTRPDLRELVGADIDPVQTAWARLKIALAQKLSRKDFCRALGISRVDSATRDALLARAAQDLPADDRSLLKTHRAFFARGAFDEGTFEKLFACWREFLWKFVSPRERIEGLFEGDDSAREAILDSPVWPVGFELFFHQSLLTALFGPDPVQHAPPGSYPRYFRARFEAALTRPDAGSNPYLSHVLRGRYGALEGRDALPDYLLPERFELLKSATTKVRLYAGTIADALTANPGPYHLIQLSNILDWSSEEASEALAKPVLEHLAPGGYLLVRQLNNVRPLPHAWLRSLDFAPALERELHAAARRVFYSAIRAGRKL